MKFIFITGGVVSSVGKGIAAASIGSILEGYGYKVRIRKMDPYLNIDPGTMSPYEHGEVFVTEDGAETDLDLGHYERFTSVNCSRADSISAGQIFNNVIKKERKGDYLGSTVQIIPHITDEIKKRIQEDLTDEDFVICEIGGTVGDIESTPFLEAIRQFYNEKSKDSVLFIHVTLLLYLKGSGEIKTKPTQHSVKELQSSGIKPNILLCRSEVRPSKEEINKLALFCNVKKEDIIPALECSNLNEIVINYCKERLGERTLNYFNIKDNNVKNKSLVLWENLLKKQNEITKQLKLYIVAKYLKNKDAYLSLESALQHAATANKVKLDINWLKAEDLEHSNNVNLILKDANGILVPGGYGKRGIEGKIKAIQYGRENNIPTLGICLGSQLMVIEALRNVVKISDVGSTEFGDYKNKAVSLLTEWHKGNILEKRGSNEDLGGSMRLGTYPCKIKKGTLASRIYKQETINERHRHRYEINNSYEKELEEAGIIISGFSPDGLLPEIIESKNHNFFIGVQFHPEFKSRPFDPHLIFYSFIEAQLKK